MKNRLNILIKEDDKGTLRNFEHLIFSIFNFSNSNEFSLLVHRRNFFIISVPHFTCLSKKHCSDLVLKSTDLIHFEYSRN